jgi:hypothetical protein
MRFFPLFPKDSGFFLYQKGRAKKRDCIISQMKALRFGYMEFDSDTCPNKKEAVPIYETTS